MKRFANICALGLRNEECATDRKVRAFSEVLSSQSSEQKSNNALSVIVTVAHILCLVLSVSLRSMTFLRRNLGINRTMIIVVLSIILPDQVTAQTSSAIARWCEPPVTPAITTLELAREFREEFKSEFEQYFLDASRYTTCLDAERTRIFAEMQNTANRYERFLDDSTQWEPAQ